MSNVIAFLEKMGQNATMRHATLNEMELVLTCAQIDPELQGAILSRDQSRLEELLGARTNLVCGVFPGKEDDDDEKEPEPSTPDDDDEIIMSGTAVRRIA